MANQDLITFCAVGDWVPGRDDPETTFALTTPILKNADIAFLQLERILSDRPDMALCRQVYRKPAEAAKALTNAGINVVSVAGNHHMNAGPGGFIDTLTVLKQNKILPVGVGMNIAEARKAGIIERKGVKVAFLGYSSIIPKAEILWDAGATTPGCAPMYVSTFYEQTDWQPGTPPKIITVANKQDLAAMVEDIKRAKSQADIVIVSQHWGVHYLEGVIADYEYEVGHAAIDAGADLILGNHAHVIQGIEVYRGKAIFHCIANFASDVTHSTPGTRTRWSSLSPDRSKHEAGWGRYPEKAVQRKTMIVKCLISGKKIEKVSYLPCMINQNAQCEPIPQTDKRSDEVKEYVEWTTQAAGMDTKFARDGDEMVVLT